MRKGVAIGTVLLALAAGCGGDDDSSQERLDEGLEDVGGTVATEPETTTTTEPGVEYLHSWTAQVELPDGFSWSQTFEAGELTLAEAGGDYGRCVPDPERDAVMPVRLSYVLPDGGFSGDIEARVAFARRIGALGGGYRFVYFDLQDASRSMEVDIGEGCADVYDVGDMEVRWSDVSPGTSDEQEGWLVFKNYRSPNFPQGDPSYIDNVWLRFGGTSGTQQVAVRSLEGPGALVLCDDCEPGSRGMVAGFPLDGTG